MEQLIPISDFESKKVSDLTVAELREVIREEIKKYNEEPKTATVSLDKLMRHSSL